jgi:hypothetical protein
MATRSNIAMRSGAGFKVVYCHWDGYPTYVGKILKNNYKNKAKVKELISLGDISSLGPEIGEKQDFENPVEGWTLFYGRDRGESGVGARRAGNLEKLVQMADRSNAQYLYIYDNGKWAALDVIDEKPVPGFANEIFAETKFARRYARFNVASELRKIARLICAYLEVFGEDIVDPKSLLKKVNRMYGLNLKTNRLPKN